MFRINRKGAGFISHAFSLWGKINPAPFINDDLSATPYTNGSLE